MNGDGFTVPQDVLLIINDINAQDARQLPAEYAPGKPFVDTTGDQFLAPQDVLIVINAIGAGNGAPYELRESDRLNDQATVTITVGQPFGSRSYRLAIDADFDTTDGDAVLGDLFTVSLVRPANTGQTLLDRGTPGTTLFALGESGAELVPGLSTWNGRELTLDLTDVADAETGLLKLQLLGTDTDSNTRATVRPLANELDPDGTAGLRLLDETAPAAPGAALDVTGLAEQQDVEASVDNVRFDETTGRIAAEVRLWNLGDALGRKLAVAFPGLPAGVTLRNSAGTTAGGAPYLNFAPAIVRGGLTQNSQSERLLVEFDNPAGLRFTLAPEILAGTNQPPTLAAIGPLTVMPGGTLSTQLAATDPDGDAVTFSLASQVGANAPATPVVSGSPDPLTLPNGILRGNGRFEFSPSPDQLGQYTFDVIASDGALAARRTVTLDVVADPTTSTRVSGLVLDVDQSPLVGMQVEIGAVQGLTAFDGSFTLDLGSGPVVSDTIKIRGEMFPGPAVYPFIAEKLAFILDHDLFLGVNNVVHRPIYLPALDEANGKPIDPVQDALVTTDAIPGVSVFVAAGTLMNQQGTPFTGTLSITEVPRDLTPAALPDTLFPDLVVTIQPGEMVFATPAPMTFPNRAGWAPGTKMDLWSVNPVTGEFGDVGDMEVSAAGSTIDTISGGVRNSSWHVPEPPPPPVKTKTQRDPKNPRQDMKEFPKCSRSTSMCELHSGAIIETHDLVSYQSLGEKDTHDFQG